MTATQLPLWDAPKTTEDDILIQSYSWADGDSRPTSLERLAESLLGNLVGGIRQRGTASPVVLNYHLNRDVYRRALRPEIERVFYRVISTSVIDGRVLAGCSYLCTVSEFYGGHNEPLPDEDEGEPAW